MARVSLAALTASLGLLLFALPASPALAEGSQISFREHYFSDAGNSQAFYLDVTGAAGIIRGDAGVGGSCRPSAPVTRAEFTVMVLRLLSLEPEFEAPRAGNLPFRDAADVPSWAASAVAACSSLGIVSGEPDGLGGFDFNPSGNVSGAEAVAMLLRTLGNGENVTGGWPSGYLFRAYETGLFASGVTPGDWRFVEPLKPLTRAQMAYLIHNALFGSRGFHPGTPGREGTFSLGSIGAHLSGYSLIVDANLLLRQLTTSDGRRLDLADTVVAPGVGSSSDLVGWRIFWVKNARGQVTFLRCYARGTAVTGELSRLVVDDGQDRVLRVELADGRSFTLTPGAIVKLNGRRWPFDPAAVLPLATAEAIVDQGRATHVSIVQDDLPEAVIRAISFDQSTGAEPGESTTGRITARISMGRGDIPLVVGPDTAIYLNGKPADLTDLRERDVFYAATTGSIPKGAVRLYAYRNQVTGTVADVARLYDSAGFHLQVEVENEATGQKRTMPFSPFCSDLVSPALTGRPLTLSLNRLGEVTFFETPAPEPGRARAVKVLRSATARGNRFLTVDWQGSELTYLLPAEVPAPAAGGLARITVDSAGNVTQTEAVRPAMFEATVVAFDDLAGRLILTRDEKNWGLIIRRVPIYATTSAADQSRPGAAVPPETLAAGQTLLLDDPGAPAYILAPGQQALAGSGGL